MAMGIDGSTRFDDFLKDKAAAWTSIQTSEYEEVEHHRALASQPATEERKAVDPAHPSSGHTGDAALEGREKAGFEDFGKGMLKYWGFGKECKPLSVFHRVSDRADEARHQSESRYVSVHPRRA
jgi:hypothetical protein